METIQEKKIETKSIKGLVESALEKGKGVLRLAPNWVPRSFMHPGRRLKLHPDDLYAYGLNRGGINERWFSSTTEAANEGRVFDEGLSYIVHGKSRFTLREAVKECGALITGENIWKKYGKWPVYSKFFDNMGPIPHHLHQSFEQAKLVGCEGKPESYYFPPQHNYIFNNFPYTFFGLEPGTKKEDVIRCLANWNKGDNGILDLSKAYRLQPGTGWLLDPCILHAPGSFCTYEPQWGSDVFGMYQNLVEGREVPWSLLVKDMPKEKHQDIEFIMGQIAWDKNVDERFKENHFLEPIIAAGSKAEGCIDKWVVYGEIDKTQYFTAKELTILPGVKCTIKDNGSYGLQVMQGRGRMNGLSIESPNQIRFGEMTSDEVFCIESAAKDGVVFENTSETDPLVVLRYFGPEVNPDAPVLKKV